MKALGGLPLRVIHAPATNSIVSAILLLARCVLVSNRAAGTNIVWTNAAGGDWNVANNWSPNIVPGSNDTATIQQSVTVTVDTPSECGGLTLGNAGGSSPTLAVSTNAELAAQNFDLISGTLNGAGTLTVSNAMTWLSGTMSGSGRTVISPGATLSLANLNFVQLSGRRLENGGTVVWTGAGTITLSSGAVITNRPGALFDIQTATSFSSLVGSSPRFDNVGTLRKSVSNGTHSVPTNVSINNYGTLEIQTGTLFCGGPLLNDGTIALSPGTTNRMAGGGSGIGVFNAPAGTLVEWTAGTFILSTGAQLDGTGLYKINFGTVVANPDLVVENFELAAGALDGPGLVTVNNAWKWTGGNMTGSGRTFIPSNVTLTVSNLNFVQLAGRTLDNAGTILWTGNGDITLTSHAVITNRAGALFHVQNAANFSSVVGGDSRFDNAGIFRKSGNFGTTSVANSISFNNYALMEILSGTFLSGGTFTNSGTVNLSAGTTNRITGSGSATGSFNVPVGALVDWNTGIFTLNPGAQLDGGGLYKVSGATLIGNTDVTVENLDLTGGALDGANIFTINRVMNWSAGNMNGSGRTFIPSGAALSIANLLFLEINGRTLESAGAVLWTGAGNITLTSSAVITNRPGALLNIQNAQPFATVGATRIDNAGTFRKSGNSGTTTFVGVSFTNYGTVEIRSGVLMANGACTFTSNSLLNCAIGGTNAGTGYGRLQAAGAVTINGAVSVDLINGFVPSTNDTFTVLTNATRNGAFTRFYYPSNQVRMELNSTPGFVTVRVTGVVVPPPVLLTPMVSGTDMVLTWTAVSNANYRVEFNPDLNPTNWNAITGDVVAVGNTASKSDVLTPGNRFYRVVVIP